MKKIIITLAIFSFIFSTSFSQKLPSKNDKEYSKIDFYFDSLYAYKFKEYLLEKEKVEIDGLYNRIDQAIINASTVKTLEITNSAIKKLPKGFEKLNKLESITFRNCKNLDLKSTFKYLSKFPKLPYLEISYSNKYQLPNNISLLTQVEKINLKRNKFVVLPETFT